jgi:hypothetical protein
VELFDHTEIQVLFGLVAAGAQQGDLVFDRPGKLAQQCRLADPGVALDDHELRLAVRRRVERSLQCGQLDLAADQLVRGALLTRTRH